MVAMAAPGRAALLAIALLFGAFFPSASAASSYPARIAGRLLSTTASAVAKQLWSLKSAATKTATAAVAGRPKVRYEGGYAVDTVFDGSKLGIEPHAVEITPAGDLLVLDSINSNIYRVQLPLSPFASESAFSTGGRILDDFRSSLTPFMVEALVCTHDWLRRATPFNVMENTEELTKYQDDLIQEFKDFTIIDGHAAKSQIQGSKKRMVTSTNITLSSQPSKTSKTTNTKESKNAS